MKILIVSNLYPPYYIGGYELRCALAAEGLRQAGHDVRVLTSRYGSASSSPLQENVKGVEVSRVLGQYLHGRQPPRKWPYFLAKVRPQLQDARYFIRTLDEFKPDVVNWWAISGLTEAILSIPSFRGIPDMFCVDDPWIIEKSEQEGEDQRPPWVSLWSKHNKPWYWSPALTWTLERWKAQIENEGIVTSRVPFRPTHACFVSEFLRAEYEAAGFKCHSQNVVHGGLPAQKFFFKREPATGDHEPVRLLYAGAITRDRGLHTAIEALSFLPREVLSLTTLTVVGEALDTRYLRELEEGVRTFSLSERVMFIGKKTHDEMPKIYRRHDLLVAPSLRKEGLPFTMIEAMLSGCAVVTTGSGGAMEIAHLADLPLFPKEDAKALSRILEELITNRQALGQIAKRGQDVALREFTLDRMLDGIQTTLRKVVKEQAQR